MPDRQHSPTPHPDAIERIYRAAVVGICLQGKSTHFRRAPAARREVFNGRRGCCRPYGPGLQGPAVRWGAALSPARVFSLTGREWQHVAEALATNGWATEQEMTGPATKLEATTALHSLRASGAQEHK